jgi:hypothetical protein
MRVAVPAEPPVLQDLPGRALRDLAGSCGFWPGVELEEQIKTVRAGTWAPPEQPAAGDDSDPTFRTYAASWLEDNMLEPRGPRDARRRRPARPARRGETDKAVEVAALRRQGLTHPGIAQRLSIATSTAHYAGMQPVAVVRVAAGGELGPQGRGSVMRSR